jgi:hypothetical protein
MKGKRLLGLIGILIALVTVLAGCEALPSLSSVTPGTQSGKLVINITDAPPDLNIEKVMLTVSSVEIHVASNNVEETTSTTTETTTETAAESNDGWKTLDLNPNLVQPFNLLDYQSGLQALLADGELIAGKYTQIRMNVDKFEVILKGDPDPKDTKLPSNSLKFVHPFEIVGGQVTEILFDFDALKSINETGNGKYMCKPVIKLTTTKEPKATGSFKITTPQLPNGSVGVVYNLTTLAVASGTAPYTWSINAGAIPPGLTLDGVAGTISGIPTIAGNYTITVKVEDSTLPTKMTATKEFTVAITSP